MCVCAEEFPHCITTPVCAQAPLNCMQMWAFTLKLPSNHKKAECEFT